MRNMVFWLCLLTLAGSIAACAATPTPVATPGASTPAPLATDTKVPTAVASAAPVSTLVVSATPVPSPVVTTAPTLAPSPAATALPSVVNVTKAPEGNYLFVEAAYGVDGTGKLQMMYIDFPMYRFDQGTGILKPFAAVGLDKFVLSPTEWGFYGHVSYRRGAAGGGGTGDLLKIASLPLDTTIYVPTGVNSEGRDEGRSAPLKLVAASSDGTLEAVIDGERAVLATGRAWTRTLNQDVATNAFNGHYTITATLTNYGWQARAKIQMKP